MKMEALEDLLIYFTTNILILREYIINTNDGTSLYVNYWSVSVRI